MEGNGQTRYKILSTCLSAHVLCVLQMSIGLLAFCLSLYTFVYVFMHGYRHHKTVHSFFFVVDNLDGVNIKDLSIVKNIVLSI